MSNAERGEGFPSSIDIRVGLGDGIDWAKAMADLEEEAGGAAEVSPEPLVARVEPERTAGSRADRAPGAEDIGAAAPGCEPEPAATAPKAVRPLSKYEELCRKPSMTMEREDIKVIGELSEVLAEVNEALAQFEKFIAANPAMLRESTVKTCTDNLKDTASVMFREFHALRNGRLNKCYDKRCVCTKCQGVFLTPLPDGICDECKAAMVPKTAPY